jgi:Protein of unknown function (DUF3618)
MEPSKNEIRREIEATRAAMAEKIETLEARVGDVIHEAKRSVDPKYQTQKRPWLMVGLAVATGYLFEGIIFGKAPPRVRGRKFDIDPERRAYLEGKQKAAGGGILRSIATAAGVALARDYATKIVSGRGFSSWSAPSEDRSKVKSPYEL